MPSNGTEGMVFTDKFCEHCLHEKFHHTLNHNDKKCDIFSRSIIYWYEPENPKYPSEWIYNNEGWPVCTNWQKWDWNQDDDDNWNDPPGPPEPPSNDPNQLLMPFSIWELLGVDQDVIVTKEVITEKSILEEIE